MSSIDVRQLAIFCQNCSNTTKTRAVNLKNCPCASMHEVGRSVADVMNCKNGTSDQLPHGTVSVKSIWSHPGAKKRILAAIES